MDFIIDILQISTGNFSSYNQIRPIIDKAKSIICYDDIFKISQIKSLKGEDFLKTVMAKLFQPNQRECFSLIKQCYESPEKVNLGTFVKICHLLDCPINKDLNEVAKSYVLVKKQLKKDLQNDDKFHPIQWRILSVVNLLKTNQFIGQFLPNLSN